MTEETELIQIVIDPNNRSVKSQQFEDDKARILSKKKKQNGLLYKVMGALALIGIAGVGLIYYDSNQEANEYHAKQRKLEGALVQIPKEYSYTFVRMPGRLFGCSYAEAKQGTIVHGYPLPVSETELAAKAFGLKHWIEQHVDSIHTKHHTKFEVFLFQCL